MSVTAAQSEPGLLWLLGQSVLVSRGLVCPAVRWRRSYVFHRRHNYQMRVQGGPPRHTKLSDRPLGATWWERRH